MPQMQILKVTEDNLAFLHTTTFLLLDEQQQYVLSLPLREDTFPAPMHIPSRQDKGIAEPLTIDFLGNVLSALGGTIEEIVLDTLPDDQLYARVQLRDHDRQQTIRAPLGDALRLAHREYSRIIVPTEILKQQGVSLKDYGATRQEQIATVEKLAEQNPAALRPVPEEPYNLDFSDGLRGWNFIRGTEYGSYALDPQVTYAGKACFTVTMHKPYTMGSAGFLSHTNFLANRYRGKRLRLIAYVKVENIHQPIIELMISGPAESISSLTGQPIRASRLTRSRIIPPTQGSDWTRHELVIDVPDNAHDIRFSFGTHEQGKIWLGGIRIETVEQNIALTGTILRPSARLPLNLDFSQGLEYWSIEGSAPWHYEHGIDDGVTSHTTASAYLKALIATSDSPCILQQMIDAEQYQGKQVRLRAHLKTADVEKASLFIGRPFRSLGDSIEETITGTTEWASYALIYHVSQTPWNLLSFGVSLHNKGQVWLAGVSLEVLEDRQPE